MQALFQALVQQGWLSHLELSAFLNQRGDQQEKSLSALAEHFPERREAFNRCLSIALGIPWAAPEILAIKHPDCELETNEGSSQGKLHCASGHLTLITRPEYFSGTNVMADASRTLTAITDDNIFHKQWSARETSTNSLEPAARTSLSFSALQEGDIHASLSGHALAQTASHPPARSGSNNGIMETDSESAPAVKLLNQIFSAAIQRKASDIHVEAFHQSARVRFRIDGRLTAHDTLSLTLHQQLISRLKILAELDITERRQPQDGRLSISLSGHAAINMRLSILPTASGEKAVIRVQSQANAVLPLSHLGLEMHQIDQVKAAINRHQGLVLVTGPTGSGKTQTLYALLEQMNQIDRNLVTLEDPVEIDLPGINQVAVSATSRMTFQHALKSLLRQDPDIIMLGEIRDRETADTAIKAAQTGHLMLSTLHTNGCTESLIRLINLGVAPYNLSDTLTLIIAQRLLRKLCPHCKRSEPPTAITHVHAIAPNGVLDNAECYQPVGCDACQHGYSGRIAIFELLPVSAALSQCLTDNSPLSHIRQQCTRQISKTLAESAISAWARGLTSYHEIAPYLQASHAKTSAYSPTHGNTTNTPTIGA